MKRLIYAYAEKPQALLFLVLVICACIMISTCTYVEVAKMVNSLSQRAIEGKKNV